MGGLNGKKEEKSATWKDNNAPQKLFSSIARSNRRVGGSVVSATSPIGMAVKLILAAAVMLGSGAPLPVALPIPCTPSSRPRRLRRRLEKARFPVNSLVSFSGEPIKF